MAENHCAIEMNVAAVGERGDGVAGAGFGAGVGEWLDAVAMAGEIEDVNAQALRGEALAEPGHDVAIRGETVEDDGVTDWRLAIRLHHGDGRVAGVDLILERGRPMEKGVGCAGGDECESERGEKGFARDRAHHRLRRRPRHRVRYRAVMRLKLA